MRGKQANGPRSFYPNTTETRQSRFEQSVALTLNLWPALTLAVQNNWGGDDSADKRDWLAGQVVEQFPSLANTNSNNPSASTPTPSSSTTKDNNAKASQQQKGDKNNNKTKEEEIEEPDAEYIEELLLQVMLDEFEVNIDDDSAYDVATEIIRLRGQCAKGNFSDVDRLLTRWQGRKGVKVVFTQGGGGEDDQDTDWDDTDGDDDEDEDMDEAPPLAAGAGEVAQPKKEKQAPEVDEDGFTKVTRKR